MSKRTIYVSEGFLEIKTPFHVKIHENIKIGINIVFVFIFLMIIIESVIKQTFSFVALASLLLLNYYLILLYRNITGVLKFNLRLMNEQLVLVNGKKLTGRSSCSIIVSKNTSLSGGEYNIVYFSAQSMSILIANEVSSSESREICANFILLFGEIEIIYKDRIFDIF